MCTLDLVRAEWNNKTCTYQNDCYQPKGELRRPTREHGTANKCDDPFVVNTETREETSKVGRGFLMLLSLLTSAVLATVLIVEMEFVCFAVPWYFCGSREPLIVSLHLAYVARAKRAESKADAAYQAALRSEAEREAEAAAREAEMTPERRAELEEIARQKTLSKYAAMAAELRAVQARFDATGENATSAP